MNTINISLPEYTHSQYQVVRHPAKRKVICNGRRAGKTLLSAKTSVERALHGSRALYAAPTDDQTEMYWSYVKEWLDPLIKGGLVRKLEKKKTIEFPNGGRIKAKTAWDADSLRGDYADFLILDEYAFMNPDTWESVGQPMLLDNDGDAWFPSTPLRMNHFHDLYMKCHEDGDRWASFHFTSESNPFLSKAALKELIADMDDEAYRQEILAEFLEGEGAVFRNIPANLWNPTAEDLEEHKNHKLILTIDWGKRNDFTIADLGCVDCQCELFMDRFNTVDYTIQRDRIKKIYDDWKPEIVLGEANAMGEPNLEQLNEDGVPISAFWSTHQSKSKIIRQLSLALEKEQWKWLDNPIATGELMSYEMKETRMGNLTFNAPKGKHDDTVITRALMVYGAVWGSVSLGFV